MDSTAELNRRLENLIRLGTIAAVDPATARCRVKTGGLDTEWLPWLAQRAGSDRDWNPPSVGEQCMVICPSGDPAIGIVLLGIYSSAAPANDDSLARHRRSYRDGAVIEYDTETHALRATLPAGGTAALSAPGGVTITGNTQIIGTLAVTDGATVTGTLSATVDVTAAGISLVGHTHPGDSGGTTGAPQ